MLRRGHISRTKVSSTCNAVKPKIHHISGYRCYWIDSSNDTDSSLPDLREKVVSSVERTGRERAVLGCFVLIRGSVVLVIALRRQRERTFIPHF
jgi:hypothetical protein